MAKHMQCVQAILDCLKKVKAEYHNVIGLNHRKSAVFDIIKPHLSIKMHSPSPACTCHFIQAFEPKNEHFIVKYLYKEIVESNNESKESD